jgi:hypothetical protein
MTSLKLANILSQDLYHNEDGKKEFHKEAKKVLKKVAKLLSIPTSDYNLSSNKGGVAVSGEVTLHTNSLYLQISQSMGKANVLYRSCNGQKDYSGGSNNYLDINTILDETGISKLQRVM